MVGLAERHHRRALLPDSPMRKFSRAMSPSETPVGAAEVVVGHRQAQRIQKRPLLLREPERLPHETSVVGPELAVLPLDEARVDPPTHRTPRQTPGHGGFPTQPNFPRHLDDPVLLPHLVHHGVAEVVGREADRLRVAPPLPETQRLNLGAKDLDERVLVARELIRGEQRKAPGAEGLADGLEETDGILPHPLTDDESDDDLVDRVEGDPDPAVAPLALERLDLGEVLLLLLQKRPQLVELDFTGPQPLEMMGHNPLDMLADPAQDP